jgi:cytochrome P450
MDEKVDFAVSFDDLTETCSERLLDPAWKIREFLTGKSKKAQFDKDVIGKHAIAIIEKRRREGYHAEKKDLLQLFMETKDEDGKPLTDEYISSIILNFTVRSHKHQTSIR